MASNATAAKRLIESVTVRVPPMAYSSCSSPSPGKLCRRESAVCLQRNRSLYPSNFKRSGLPNRVMFYRNECWTDFPKRVVDLLRSAFVERKAVVNVEIEGSTFLVDFNRMLQIDSRSGSQRSIAWIDEEGRCFFPKVFASADDELKNGPEGPKIEIQIRVGVPGMSKREAVDEDEDEVTSSMRQPIEEKEVTSMIRQRIEANSPGACLWPNVKQLREEERAFAMVSNLFLTEMKKFGAKVSVTAIRHCVCSGPLEVARLEVFKKQIEITKAARGSANVVYAWYGGSASDIRGVLAHGFGAPNKISGSVSHGVGLHLSHSSLPHASAMLSKPDHNGEKHVLLCRVILGNVEKVEAGSQQCYPSGDEFDTGVDNIGNPKWFVVWSTNMNRHVIPQCVVSYKSIGHVPAELAVCGETRYPVGELFSKIRGSLPPSKVEELTTMLSLFKGGKMPRDDFLKRFRSATGDQLLISAIQEMHGLKQGS